MRIVQFRGAIVLVASLAAAGSVCAQTAPVNYFTSGEIAPPDTSQTSGAPPPSSGGLRSSDTTGFSAGTFGLDYAHFSPKTGSNGDQWGLSGSGLFGLTPSLSLQLDGGYHRISGSGSRSDLNNYMLGGSLIYSTGDWRFGGDLAFEKDKQGIYSAAVTNYGVFGQHWWRMAPGPTWEAHAKAGGFNVDHNFGHGYYVGGGASFFPTPNWSIGAGIDHTHFNPFGGSDEDDYWLGFEDYFCPPHRLSIWGGYARSEFSPGSFHVDTVAIGFRWYLNGEGKPTLVEQHSTGVLSFSPAFTAIQYKF
jgi:opacity protein-like surface antigen